MPHSRPRLLFVINRGAGPKNDIDREFLIRNYFEPLGYEPGFYFMRSRVSGIKLSDAIEEFKPHSVIAVGGDGTLNYTAQHVQQKKLSLGLIPTGSSNGMAKELGIPVDMIKAMDIIDRGKTRIADAIRINKTEICLHLSDLGLNAHLVKYFNKSRVRGNFGYMLALAKALVRNHPIRVYVQTKEKDLHTTALMVIVANASMYGTGATINPDGHIDDGYFEVVIVHKIGISELLNMFFKFRRFDPSRIEVYRAKAAILETTARTHFQIDGEYAGKVKKVTAEILPGKLKIIVP